MSHDPHADPDMLRQAAPCAHKWHYLDEYDVFWCSLCRRTESPDDEPPEAA